LASYDDIRTYLEKKHGYSPKAYAIAHAKEIFGIPTKKAPNRKGERKWLCPKNRLEIMEEAFKHFGMI